jgi:hypothetical protein
VQLCMRRHAILQHRSIVTIRKDHKGFDGSTELGECPELSRTVTKTEISHAKQTSAVVPNPLTMADKSPVFPFSYVGQGRKGKEKTDFEQKLTEVTEISVASLRSCVKLLCLRFLRTLS